MGLVTVHGEVSIRARHCWRANLKLGGHTAPAWLFQSAPAIAGGRIAASGQQGIAVLAVSIRARHCWRANLGKTCTTSPARRFNPRPPLLAGESAAPFENAPASRKFQSAPAIAGGRIMSTQKGRNVRVVSIRARHCWRANPLIWPIRLLNLLFQSAPAIAGGRIRQVRVWLKTICQFQSAPAIAGGRIGDVSAMSMTESVSIRARHCWRANQR